MAIIERGYMSEIKNVTLSKEMNCYFDGKVTSRSFTLADGSKQSLGVMMPGEYEFGTAEKEIMEILSGELDVMLPDANEWLAVKAGDTFEVPANAKFQLKIHQITDYCCSYLS